MFGSKWGFRRRRSKNQFEEDTIPLREKSVASTNNQVLTNRFNKDNVPPPTEPEKGLNMSFSSISSTLSKAATNIDISFAPPLSRNNSDSGSDDDASAPVYLTMEETLSLGVLDHLDRPIAVLDNDSEGSNEHDSILLFENGSESTGSLMSNLASVKSGIIPDPTDQNKENNLSIQRTNNRPVLQEGLSGHVDESHDESYNHKVLYPPGSPEYSSPEEEMSDSGYQCSEVGSSYYESDNEQKGTRVLLQPNTEGTEQNQPTPIDSEPTTSQKSTPREDSAARPESESSNLKASDATQQFWMNCLEENGVDLAGSPVFSRTSTLKTEELGDNQKNSDKSSPSLHEPDTNFSASRNNEGSKSISFGHQEAKDSDESTNIPAESLQYSIETARSPPRRPFDIDDLMAKPEEVESRLIYSPSLCDNSTATAEPQPVQSPRDDGEMNLLSLTQTMSILGDEGENDEAQTLLMPRVSRTTDIDEEYHCIPDNASDIFAGGSSIGSQNKPVDTDKPSNDNNTDHTTLARDFYSSERESFVQNSDQKKDGSRGRDSGSGDQRNNDNNEKNDLPGDAGDDNRDDDDDKRRKNRRNTPESEISSSEESSNSREEDSPDRILKSFGEAKNGLHFDIVKSFDESELSPKSKKSRSSFRQDNSPDRIIKSFGEAKNGLHFDIVKSFDESELSPKSKKRNQVTTEQRDAFRFDSPQRISASIVEAKDAVRFDITELSPRRRGNAKSQSPFRGDFASASGLLEPPLVQRTITNKSSNDQNKAEIRTIKGDTFASSDPRPTDSHSLTSTERVLGIGSWEEKGPSTAISNKTDATSDYGKSGQSMAITSKVSFQESTACDPETDALYSARKDDTSMTTASLSIVTTASAFAARLETDPNKWMYEVWARKGLLNDEKWRVLNLAPAVTEKSQDTEQAKEEILTLTLPEKDKDSSIDEEAERETSPLMANSAAGRGFGQKEGSFRRAGIGRKSLPSEKHTSDLKKTGPRRKTFSNIMQMWRDKDDVAPALLSPQKVGKGNEPLCQPKDDSKREGSCSSTTTTKKQWSPQETLGIKGRQSPEDWTEKAHKDIQRFQPELVFPKTSSSPVSQTAIVTGKQSNSAIAPTMSMSTGGDSFDTQQVNSIFREKASDSLAIASLPQQEAIVEHSDKQSTNHKIGPRVRASGMQNRTPQPDDTSKSRQLNQSPYAEKKNPSERTTDAGFMVTPPSRRFQSPPQRFHSAGRQRPTKEAPVRPKSAPRARIHGTSTNYESPKTDKYGFSIDNQLQNPSRRTASTSKKKRSSAALRERHVERTNRKPGTFNLAAPRSSKAGADYKSVVRTFLCTRGPGEETQNPQYALVARDTSQTPSQRVVSQTSPSQTSKHSPSNDSKALMPKPVAALTPTAHDKSMNDGVDTPQSQWIQLYQGGRSSSIESPRENLQLAVSGISYDAADSVFSEDDEYGTNDECHCVSSVFSGNRDLAEFFLPRMSQACTCGRTIPELIDPDEPTSLKNILKPWQCRFLAGFGISRGDQLVKAHHRSAQALATSLRKYRQKHHMVPFKTKSCGVALQIWSKTSKAYVRSIRKQLIHGTDCLRPPNTMDVLTSFLDKMQDAEQAASSDPLTPALIRHEDDIRAQEEEI